MQIPILQLHKWYGNILSCNIHFSWHLMVKKCLSLYMTPIDLEIFLVKLEIWYFQLKEESTKTPRHPLRVQNQNMIFIIVNFISRVVFHDKLSVDFIAAKWDAGIETVVLKFFKIVSRSFSSKLFTICDTWHKCFVRLSCNQFHMFFQHFRTFPQCPWSHFIGLFSRNGYWGIHHWLWTPSFYLQLTFAVQSTDLPLCLAEKQGIVRVCQTVA